MPIDAQCESSNPGCAHNGAPFTHGESPGWNFQGPFSATAEFPSVINSGEEVDEVAGVLAAFAVCEKARGKWEAQTEETILLCSCLRGYHFAARRK
jgi:hypothetical protein